MYDLLGWWRLIAPTRRRRVVTKYKMRFSVNGELERRILPHDPKEDDDGGGQNSDTVVLPLPDDDQDVA